MFGNTNPAMWIAVLTAVLTLMSTFGVALSGGKTQAILGLATVLFPILGGLITKASVYSPASAKTALAMPPDSTPQLLDRVIAAGVEVEAGDTRSEVLTKVKRAEA